MNATVDGDNLLAAILSQSDDATARLAYADWLEEESRGNLASPLMIRAGMIRGRKYSKIVGGWRTIFPDLGDFVVQYGLEVWIDGDRWRYADAIRPPILDDTVAVKIVRGFVAEVLCTQEAWLKTGPQIVASHPVRSVGLIDKSPWMNIDESKLWMGHFTRQLDWDLDMRIFTNLRAGSIVNSYSAQDFLRRYKQDDNPLADLSQACICWAKVQNERSSD